VELYHCCKKRIILVRCFNNALKLLLAREKRHFQITFQTCNPTSWYFFPCMPSAKDRFSSTKRVRFLILPAQSALYFLCFCSRAMHTSLFSQTLSQNLGLVGKLLLLRQPPADWPLTQDPKRFWEWYSTFSNEMRKTRCKLQTPEVIYFIQQIYGRDFPTHEHGVVALMLSLSRHSWTRFWEKWKWMSWLVMADWQDFYK